MVNKRRVCREIINVMELSPTADLIWLTGSSLLVIGEAEEGFISNKPSSSCVAADAFVYNTITADDWIQPGAGESISGFLLTAPTVSGGEELLLITPGGGTRRCKWWHGALINISSTGLAWRETETECLIRATSTAPKESLWCGNKHSEADRTPRAKGQRWTLCTHNL